MNKVTPHFVITHTIKMFTFLVLCLVGTAFAEVPGRGRCPDVEVDPNFNVSKFLGRWYEAERSYTGSELTGKCGTRDYTVGENGTVKVVNSELSESTGNLTSIVGIARVPNDSEPAKFKIQFSSVPLGIEVDFWVLGTDYDSFSIVFACFNWKMINFRLIRILTRQQNPDAAVITKAYRIITKNKLDGSKFWKIDQTNCKKSEQKTLILLNLI